ncbi:DUF4760 domain-containing protein [Acinetobacter pollinis]|uniref:DUF4760 domain-containing protein n=1 Tax=Acinetobacter pollinis TaxID=2605270 RepID=A0ABU6DQ69_9GAMM|nr:DUF4760 domain-containing protein [Acinetobacter pollinis]MBF7690537.1 DUF4760 domain-containing protein [Acinetobacter pollinis]MBF7698021.1 DUF4760 domain-containing protein [Acinetobacter pollinis]MEB5476010.1 DUF4760 domain-containing protein [Acinetobacter pollinis]
MSIDNILLLRTVLVFVPYIILAYIANKYVKDKFFLKPRTHIQLALIMISLIILFIEIVIWNLCIEDRNFLGFSLADFTGSRGSQSSSILVLLGIVAAVFGWLFTSRNQVLAATRNHSIQSLMSSRFSTAYSDRIEKANGIYERCMKAGCFKLKIEHICYEDNKDGCHHHNKSHIISYEDKKNLFYILNYLEFVAVGIRFGDFDEQLIKNTLGSIVVANYEFLELIIKDRQKNNPSNFEHITQLYNRWKR